MSVMVKNKTNKNNKRSQKGRSMVEMLGVLAIVGVLSVGGVYGYGVAMKKHKANELLHQASMLASSIAAQIASGKTDLVLENFGNSSYGTFSGIAQPNDEQFTMQITDMDSAVCEQMEKMAGGMVRQAECNDATLTLTYNNNLSSDKVAADYNDDANGENCEGAGYKWCSELSTAACKKDCCSGITLNSCQESCDSDTGKITNKEDETECTTADGKNGTCSSGVCVETPTCPTGTSTDGLGGYAVTLADDTKCYCTISGELYKEDGTCEVIGCDEESYCTELGSNYYCNNENICELASSCTDDTEWCSDGSLYCYNGYCNNPISCYGDDYDFADSMCQHKLGSSGYYCRLGICEKIKSCTEDSQCSETYYGTGRCYNGVCRNPISCWDHYECSEAGLSNDYFCDVTTRTCSLRKTCVNNNDCSDLVDPFNGETGNYACQDGKCQQVSCESHSDCTRELGSGYCHGLLHQCMQTLECTSFNWSSVQAFTECSDDFSSYCQSYETEFGTKGKCTPSRSCDMSPGLLCYNGYTNDYGISCQSDSDCEYSGLSNETHFCSLDDYGVGYCSVNIPCTSNMDCYEQTWARGLYCNLTLSTPRCETTGSCSTNEECIAAHGVGYVCQISSDYSRYYCAMQL